jgi:hypothetical protein
VFTFSDEGDANLSELPTAIQKRDILYGVRKMSPEQLSTLGASFEKAGWLSDAADFYSQAKNETALKAMRDRAVQEGDVFLFLKISRSLHESEVPEALLLSCAEKAEQMGKNRYALKGYERLGRADKVEQIHALIANDGDIVAEAEATVFIPASEEEVEESDEES